jgi:hypothetical protein
MSRWPVPSAVVLAWVCATLPPGRVLASDINFDRDIQPVLSRCVQCHSPGKARGGLRLDTIAGATAVLDSGKHALVPGQPEQSELLRRVSRAGSGRMPPRGEPVSARQIEALRRWIAAGAEWPAHWAYRPLVKPPLPRPPGREWARTSIDLFILDRLAEHGLTPAPEVDKRTLLRRLYFDLVGLPPTPAEVDAFLADNAADAYERVVDRLLASPHYGERWARHWMDVVHFAETHGHDQDRPRENAWPYRDYLIHAFNGDTPYARFVQEQVAGDVLFPDDPWATVATGLLAAGPWDESSLRDIREDSLDREVGRYLDRDDIVTTVMNTFASTTVQCARCHDHKFDPVKQEEYYGLQAVFAATDKANRPYDPDPQVGAHRRALVVRRAELLRQKETADPALLGATVQAEVDAWENKQRQARTLWQVLEAAECRSAGGAALARQPDGSILSSFERPDKDTYTVVAHTDMPDITGIRLEVLTNDSLPHRGPGRADNGNLHLNEFTVAAAADLDSPAPGPAPGAVVLKEAWADFNQQGWTIAHAFDGNPATAWGIYPEVGKPHRAVFTFAKPLCHAHGITLTIKLEQTHGGGHLIGRFRLSVTNVPLPADGEVVQREVSAALQTAPAERTVRQRADLAAYVLGQNLDAELAALPPPRLGYCGTSTFTADGTFRPAAGPRAVRVLKRGDIRNPGTSAAPGALACVPGLDARFHLAHPDNEGERRVELAHWLADPSNGLAWRSIANRVWQYHFGKGIVNTPDDFGNMGAPPSHPELLDWLAAALRDKGGSLKELHRLIVTSAVYRQSSQHNPSFAEMDADNRYLWRMNRLRLDAECIHDALLVFSGKLDRTMGGPSARQFLEKPGVHVTPLLDYEGFDPDNPACYRRSVYRFLFRTVPDPLMESLDCPDGSQLVPVRTASVTPVQALALLHDRFVVRQGEHIAARVAEQEPELTRQVAALYRLVLGREPTPKEIRAVGAYAAKHGLANACRVLVNSNEFMFVE